MSKTKGTGIYDFIAQVFERGFGASRGFLYSDVGPGADGNDDHDGSGRWLSGVICNAMVFKHFVGDTTGREEHT